MLLDYMFFWTCCGESTISFQNDYYSYVTGTSSIFIYYTNSVHILQTLKSAQAETYLKIFIIIITAHSICLQNEIKTHTEYTLK